MGVAGATRGVPGAIRGVPGAVWGVVGAVVWRSLEPAHGARGGGPSEPRLRLRAAVGEWTSPGYNDTYQLRVPSAWSHHPASARQRTRHRGEGFRPKRSVACWMVPSAVWVGETHGGPS